MEMNSSWKDKALAAWERDVKMMKSVIAEAKALLQNLFADISHGREKLPIRAVNVVDLDVPTKFIYVTDPMISSACSLPPVDRGCGCVDGCSDSQRCRCVIKNVGCQIPFNEDGLILKNLEQGIHECGPACKCPPTCMNRVGQSGPGQHPLEIFKTEMKGWGVRSRKMIPMGSFICEYVGEIITEAEASRRIGEDVYLYDIVGGFTIDGDKYGNVGRFVNHSCSPNAFAQNVFCGRKIMPRIMFFASRDIEALEEITYDYHYKIGSVVVNGVVKEMACRCGSSECRKRLY